MIQEHFKLAVKNIRQRKLRSWLTMIGIFIGIAAIVSLISMGEGLRVAITSQFGFLSTDVLTIQAGGVQMGPPGTGVINPLTVDDTEKIGKVAGVKASISRIVRSADSEFNGRRNMAYVVSIPDGDNRREVERIANIEIDKGRLLKDGDTYSVVLGAKYGTDDIFGKPVSVGQNIVINDAKFNVVGIAKEKGSFIMDNAVVMNDETMRELFDDDEKVDIIAVVVRNVNEMDDVQERIEKLLRKERNVDKGEEDFSVESAKKALETLNDTLFAVQLFVYIIAGISLLVGGIGIMNTMYTAVLERTKEIGIMKAIGAKNFDIFVLFFIESGYLGSVGGAIGVTFGALFSLFLSFIGNAALGSGLIRAYFPWWLIPGALLFSFSVGSIAGIIPAIGAAKLKPVDALRYTK
ncbi:ABC transporter permease [Candidatus Woesearchaeota archaeon]|nr:ABC transporter permease [Candidatus Woesearchaeota archaeon]